MKAVFFDVGGTLLRPWPSVGAVYAAAFARRGMVVAPENVDTAFRAAWKRCRPSGGGLTTSEKNWWRQLVFETMIQLGLPPSEECFQELFEVFARADAWQVYPDVHDTLTSLKARGMHVGIISNWDERLRPLMQVVGLAPLLDSLTISCEVRAEKPARVVFETALQTAGVGAEDALHVGDDLEADIRGAQSVGMRALLINQRGQGGAGQPSITDLRDVLKLV